MIRFITVQDALPLRSAVLQKGKELNLCINPEDLKPDSFHLGLYDEQNILQCILTVHKTNHPKLPHEGYRLRGMATNLEARRKGYAKELLTAAIEYIKTQLQGDYLWCIARETAYPFYVSMGFEFMSDEFQYNDAGIHKEMFIPFY